MGPSDSVTDEDIDSFMKNTNSKVPCAVWENLLHPLDAEGFADAYFSGITFRDASPRGLVIRQDPVAVKKALQLIVDSRDEKVVFGINVHDHISNPAVLAVYEERKIRKNPVDHAFTRYMKHLIGDTDMRSSKRAYLDALKPLYTHRKYALHSAFSVAIAPLQRRFQSFNWRNVASEFGNTLFTVAELEELHPLFTDNEGDRGRSSTLVAPYTYRENEVRAVGFPRSLYYYQLHQSSQDIARRIFFDLQCSCKTLPGGRRVNGLKCGCLLIEGPYTLSDGKKYTGQAVDDGGGSYKLSVTTGGDDWQLVAESAGLPSVAWWTCPGTAALAIPPTDGWRPTYNCPQWLKQPELRMVSVDLDSPGIYDSYLTNVRVGERMAFSYTPIAIDADSESSQDKEEEEEEEKESDQQSARTPKNG